VHTFCQFFCLKFNELLEVQVAGGGGAAAAAGGGAAGAGGGAGPPPPRRPRFSDDAVV